MRDWRLPKGPFTTVVADPPWGFRGAGRLGQQAKQRPKGTEFPALSEKELYSIPVKDVVADRAHLYIWTTGAKISACCHVIKAWGFELKQALVWVKRRPGGPLQIGMGRQFRTAHELVLFASRGHLLTNERNVPTVFEAPNPQSGRGKALARKPPEFYELVERQSNGPYLELFSRNTREGWTMWGNEVGKFGEVR